MQPRHELTDNPPPEAFGKIWEPLRAFNERIVGDASAHTLAILLREPATEAIIGGLWGRSLWGSMYIDIMFVPEEPRRRGIGASLVRQAEQEAIRRGCGHMWTYAFQARPFYERMGFSCAKFRNHFSRTGLASVMSPARPGLDGGPRNVPLCVSVSA
jgi:GNAT superfamily N-acetyltransferase